MTEMPTHGSATIYTSRRFHIFMRRTTISHFSFLISHSNGAFIPNQGASRPLGSPCPLQSLTSITSVSFFLGSG